MHESQVKYKVHDATCLYWVSAHNKMHRFLFGLLPISSDSRIIDDDWQHTRFNPSPRMSTYLFAFTVSEFTSTSSPHERVEINVRYLLASPRV